MISFILPVALQNNNEGQTRHWSAAEILFLREHFMLQSHAEMGRHLGRTEKAVRNHCHRLKLRKEPLPLTDDEKSIIAKWYEDRIDRDLNLAELVTSMNRSRITIGRVARSAGLSNKTRSRPKSADSMRQARQHANYHAFNEWSAADLAALDDWCKNRKGRSLNHKALAKSLGRSQPSVAHQIIRRGWSDKDRLAWTDDVKHPRGATGTTISPENRAKLDIGIKRFWDSMSKTERTKFSRRAVATRIEKYGTAAPTMLSGNAYSRTKSGKRDDLDGLFVRSSWEANYARYLNWLVAKKQIKSWSYEPQVFWFEKITRGSRSYTPDFKVVNLNNSHEWHEVKGWMDAKSKTKLKRFAKYYPDEKLVLIGAKEYASLKQFSRLIPCWE
jgi:hypothetical protein